MEVRTRSGNNRTDAARSRLGLWLCSHHCAPLRKLPSHSEPQLPCRMVTMLVRLSVRMNWTLEESSQGSACPLTASLV